VKVPIRARFLVEVIIFKAAEASPRSGRKHVAQGKSAQPWEFAMFLASPRSGRKHVAQGKSAQPWEFAMFSQARLMVNSHARYPGEQAEG